MSRDVKAASRMHAVIKNPANNHIRIIIGIVTTTTVVITPAAKSMCTDPHPQLRMIAGRATPAAAEMMNA
jgi:hypothetical protein